MLKPMSVFIINQEMTQLCNLLDEEDSISYPSQVQGSWSHFEWEVAEGTSEERIKDFMEGTMRKIPQIIFCSFAGFYYFRNSQVPVYFDGIEKLSKEDLVKQLELEGFKEITWNN